MTSKEDRLDAEKLVLELKNSLKKHQEVNSKLNDKNQEIFDKETLYFGYLNNVNNSSSTSTFANILSHSSSSTNSNNKDGPSYNSYGNIIKGFEGFVKNSIALGSGLSTGNALSQQILTQVDKDRDNKVINTISQMIEKNGKNNGTVKLSAENVIKSYLESYFDELPDLTTEKEKQILLNYYGKLKGNFALDNGFDNGYINKNLYKLLKQRQFFGTNDTDGNGQTSGRNGRNNPASLGMPSRQDIETLVFSKDEQSEDESGYVDGCELRDEDRVFSLSNAEYKNVDETY
ncbi:hypothetical protein QEN19_000941 [Hanseniaspora menglaensis]